MLATSYYSQNYSRIIIASLLALDITCVKSVKVAGPHEYNYNNDLVNSISLLLSRSEAANTQYILDLL